MTGKKIIKGLEEPFEVPPISGPLKQRMLQEARRRAREWLYGRAPDSKRK
jgi:hypothetical protein